MDIYNFDNLLTFQSAPKNKDDFSKWVLQEDIFKFLIRDFSDDYIIVYATLPHLYINSVLLPVFDRNENNINELKRWSLDNDSTWGIGYSHDDISISAPLSSCGSKLLSTGDQLIFSRSFSGAERLGRYFEINQKITHLLNVHYMDERNAWCKIDANGDILDVIKVFDLKDVSNKFFSGTVIGLKKSELEEYATAANMELVRLFDITRYDEENFNGWGNASDNQVESSSPDVFASLNVYPSYGSYSRGINFCEVKSNKTDLINKVFRSGGESKKEYCEFITQDWKNKKTVKVSCNPNSLSNYFQESDKPFEISPVFFRSEVISKYKGDTDKYYIDHNAITCRDAWHLKTFDVNEAGQVHTYIGYLSRLPFQEQLHWLQYNEDPKAPLSERVIKTDFEGTFHNQYDPLTSFKSKINDLIYKKVKWWKLRHSELLRKVQYPYTASKDEWAEEIMNLDKVLVEGLEQSQLKIIAKNLECELPKDKNLKSLQLLDLILKKSGFSDEKAFSTLTSFHVLHRLRSEIKGHVWNSDAEAHKKSAIKDHGSFMNHYKKILGDCDTSLDTIMNVIQKM
ncbi:MAG: hypothetical protein OCD01_05615 [Fibrobacterales bacterium]